MILIIYCGWQVGGYSGRKTGAVITTCLLLAVFGVVILVAVRTRHSWLPRINMVSLNF